MFKAISSLWGIVVIVILAILLTMGSILGIQYITAGPRGAVDANEQIQSGSNRIAAYEEFFSLCSSIDSQLQNIENQEDRIAATSDEDQKETLESGLIALENSKNENIAEYNANAASDYTAGQFRDSDLPYQIDQDAEEISCGA